MCIFKVAEKGEHDLSVFNFEAKYSLCFFFLFLFRSSVIDGESVSDSEWPGSS